MRTGEEILAVVGPDLTGASPRDLATVADGSGPVVVADRALLYNGDYHKVGFDLVITDGETRLTIHDYFRPGQRPDLVTPDGTSLSGAVVEALATSPDGVRVAQAGTPAAAPIIGRVEAVSGAATAVRNGVTVTLNAGDPVYRGDAVQTGSGSSVNITLVDGTALTVAANARMVLNDMVYQAGGTGNSALLSLVQGSITFLAGQVAKTGDMKVDTPVATMGIRGTMPNTIVGENGATRFSVLREPDGTVGTVVLFSKVTGLEIARVNQAGVFYSLATQTSLPTIESKTPEQIAADTALAQRVFDFATAAQQRPVVPDIQTPGPTAPDGSQTAPGGPAGGTGGSSGGGGASTFELPIPGQNNGGGNTAPSLPTTPQIVVPPLNPINFQPPNVGVNPSIGAGGGPGGPTNGGAGGPTGSGGQNPDGSTGPTPLPARSFSLAPDGGVDATGAGQGVLQRDGASPEAVAAERVTSVRLEPDGPDIAVAGPTFAVGRYGVLTISPEGTYSYVALGAAAIPGGAVESDVFTFTVDSAGASLQSTLSFAVAGVNDAPQTGFDLATAAEDGTVTAALRSGGLLGNDSDPDRGETAGLSLVALKLASGGEVALNGGSLTLIGLYGTLTVFADGTYSYGANRADGLRQGEVGRETLTYVAADAAGLRTEGSFEIRVVGLNDDPSAGGDTAGVAEGGSVAATDRANGLLGNDSDLDGGETALLAVVAARAESSGSETVLPGGGSAVIVGRYGTLTIRADGTYAYAADNATALGAEIGLDSFVYTVRDPFGATGTATLTISVQGRDDPAVIAGVVSGSVREAGTSPGRPSATGQLAAADPDGPDTFQPVAGGASSGGYGTFAITAEGLWTYTLDDANPAVNAFDAGDVLADSFTVFSADGTAQTITISIAGANDAPTVTEAAFTVAEGGVHVLAPDDIDVADPDDGEHSFVVSGVTHGRFERRDDSGTWFETAAFTDADLAAGRIRFVHDGGEIAPTFTIVASDGEASSGDFSGSVTLTPVDDPTVIGGDVTGSVMEGGAVRGTPVASGRLIGSDPDGPQNSFQPVAEAASSSGYGTFAITADGLWTYTLDDTNPAVNALDAGDVLADSFTVFSADGIAQTITISIAGANDAPVLTKAAFTVAEGGVHLLSPDDIDVADPDDADHSYVVSEVTNGRFERSGDSGTWFETAAFTDADLAAGRIRFVHDGGESAPSFTIVAIDDEASSGAFGGSVTLTPVDDPTVIDGDIFGAVVEDGAAPGVASATGQLTGADPDGPQNSFRPVASRISNSGYGTFSITADGFWTYTLDNANLDVQALQNGDQSLSDSFTVFSADGTAQVIAISIAGANDAPTVTEAAFTVAEGGAHVLGPDEIDVLDPDNRAHSYLVTGVTHGRFEQSGDSGTWFETTAFTDADLAAGRIRFVHDGGEIAPTFTIVASDGDASSAAFSGSVTFTPVNDAPTIFGPSTGAVREDQVLAATGQLSVSDPDGVGPPAWRVVGGTDPKPANYDFRVDTLLITRSPDGTGGALLYEDRFDGTMPTVDPAFGSGLTYTTNLAQSGGRGILDDETGVSDVGVGTPDIFDSVSARLRTSRSNDPANTSGLKKGAEFTVAATYDLATSLAYREAYGIRLTDRSVGNADPSLDNIGDDLIELVVRRGTDGVLRVQLRDYDNRANTVTNLQGFDLLPAAGEDQITLRLMHVAGAGSVTAAFDLLSAGAVQRTVAFTVPGSLFGSATPDAGDDELFTTAQLIAFSPATADSVLDGTYGTLVVNQAGRWDYTLRNGDPLVQALGPNDTRQDVFTIRATDDMGASDDQVITVTVRGTNDAPVVTSTAFSVLEGGTRILGPDDIDVFDPDNSVHSYTVSGVTHGVFQLRNDSGTFASTTQFTDAQIAAGAVRFVHDGGEIAPTFSIRANDGLATGPLFAGTVAYTPVNDAPELDLNGTDSMSGGANYETTFGDDTPLVDPASGTAGVTIIDVDSPNLASASVVIRNPDSGDLLFIVDDAALAALGVSAAGAGTGAITLFGTASLAAYVDALKLIRFGNEGAPAPGDRLIDFVVNDGAAASAVRTTTLIVPGTLTAQLIPAQIADTEATTTSSDAGGTPGDGPAEIGADSTPEGNRALFGSRANDLVADEDSNTLEGHGGRDTFEYFMGRDAFAEVTPEEDRVEVQPWTDFDALIAATRDDANGYAVTAFDAEIRFLNVSKALLPLHPGDFALV